ncbi:ABC transporter ATP-binding protein [Dactylosporangium roseum]|uniref:ABC transporter ATP-binding protein n=2 Tax=Dactylosporangium roseum TaxID=47989 RepID=A0ABY5ZI34_9ACTN|nr:ABC transporter ATP-binding protein [Dactylosporangium roseum]
MLRPERRLLTRAVLFTAGSVLATVAGPLLMGKAVDTIFGGMIGLSFPAGIDKAAVIDRLRTDGHGSIANMVSAIDFRPGHGIDFGALARVLIVVAVVYAIGWLLGTMAGWTAATVVQRSMHRLREQVQAKLARLPLSYLDSAQRGEVLGRLTNDIDNLGQTMQQTLSQVLGAPLTIVGVLAMMLWVSWPLALVALVTVPLSGYVARVIARRAGPRYAAQWLAAGQLNGHVEDIYSGHALVKAFGRQPEATATFHTHNRALVDNGFRAEFASSLVQPSMMFIGNLSYVLVAVVGGLRIAAGAMSLGGLQALFQYSRLFSQNISQLATVTQMLQSGVASFDRVNELLEAAEEEPDPTVTAEPGTPRGRVTFERVRFRYTEDAPLIEDLSFDVRPGQTVAIVGPTGAGKTTLVNLLMRFYEVQAGHIRIDGVDTATMTRARLRGLTGMVLQDTWLFGGTIAENIAYGRDDATPEQVAAAARAAHLEHLVRTLPDGYDTVIDDDEMGLSAGEKQLITIARAFAADPVILILDEATSAIDVRTELLVQRAMADLQRGRTSFVIAHRLSTIRDADIILVMDQGRIVEQGTHDELLQGGGYRRLYEAQFAVDRSGTAGAPV